MVLWLLDVDIIYTNIQTICLVLVTLLVPNLAPLSQDLPMILNNTFGEMPPHKQYRSAGSDLNLGACLVRGGVRFFGN